MRAKIAILVFLHVTLSAMCQTHITTNQVWQQDTIRVEESLIIDAGVSLTINSGTVVLFVGGSFMDVYGQLVINGAAEDSVVMTAPETTWTVTANGKRFNGWGGLYAYGSGSILARYTVFEKLGYSPQVKNGNVVIGVLRNESSQAMTFEHCKFKLKRDQQQTNEGCAIEGNSATIVIKSCSFNDNRGAGFLVYETGASFLTILNSTFHNNDVAGTLIYASSATILIKETKFENNKVRALLHGRTFNGSSEIEQNIFRNNLGAIELDGIYATIYFRNNLYSNNGGQIFFELGRNIITGNVFIGNSYQDPYNFFVNDYPGIVRVEYTEVSGPIIVNNSFLNNQSIALRIWAVNQYNIDNNIFYNNYPADLSTDPENMNGTGRTFQYNLLAQATTGTGNLGAHPRLNGANEFLLAANSPAIDHGSSAYASYLLANDIVENPRFKGQIDIGAVEFTNSYVPLTDVNISDTAIARIQVGEEVAQFTTTNPFGIQDMTYTLVDDNGVNNDYFDINQDKLILKKELTTESLLRIKMRAEHSSGAWLEKFYFLTATPVIVGIDQPDSPNMSIYPVPASNFLKIKPSEPGMQYAILSLTGVLTESGSLNEDSIDIRGLSDGLYILQLFSGNKIKTFKFYKHRP